MVASTFTSKDTSGVSPMIPQHEIAGLGGGNAHAGAVGAGLSSLAADKLASVGPGVSSTSGTIIKLK